MTGNSDTPPNLMLITTDQHRWDALGIAGQPVQTPHLDRLAREGCWFSHCISNAPVCVPARSILQTGYPAGKLGALGNNASVPDPEDTLAAHLARRGYSCQAIGKMHFVPRTRRNGFHHLILSEETRWLRGARSAEDVAHDDYDRFLLDQGMYGWDKPPEIGYNEIKPLVSALPAECHVTAWCGEQTVEWLRRRPDGPFFLWCSFVKPHVPSIRRENGRTDTAPTTLRLLTAQRRS
ncbi:MAG: sulfatase-like hydrolase/transferase [Chloroflexi bacterium]|nr:sulfatase-like hydrolase/transferase [Chloroflexota bacterium]